MNIAQAVEAFVAFSFLSVGIWALLHWQRNYFLGYYVMTMVYRGPKTDDQNILVSKDNRLGRILVRLDAAFAPDDYVVMEVRTNFFGESKSRRAQLIRLYLENEELVISPTDFDCFVWRKESMDQVLSQ